MSLRHPALFEPIALGTVTIPNRIVRAAHGTRLQGEEFIRYHEERAKGGVGLTILQIAGVHATSPTPGLPLDEPDVILPLYERLGSRARRHGMRVFQQLWHGGSAVAPDGSGAATWSSSPVPHPRVGVSPTPMTKQMIDDVVEGFAAAARRVREGGLDGVEIHGAHSYLVGQFLSPALNRRTDEYGGSEENRTRFLREILAAIRAEVGDFPLGVRLSADDLIEGGLDAPATSRIAQAIEAEVDFLDISYGGHWRYDAMFRTMDAPLGYQLAAAEPVTRSVAKPTIVTGRIMTLDAAEHLVTSGVADLVSMVRALIADPYLVAKARAGRAAEVRPCISINSGCVGGIKTGRIGCAVNPAAGRETTVHFDPPPSSGPSRRILVIGGGPAGMEAARAAAMRGHAVELHEMQSHLGGQLRIASSIPERADFGAITSWLEAELHRLRVTIVRDSYADLSTVDAFSPDEIVVATGSESDTAAPQTLQPGHSIGGCDLPHVFTSDDILGPGGRLPGGRVLVYDDTGTFEAITAALGATRRFDEVVLATRHDHVGWRVPYPLATVHPMVERLMAAGAHIRTGVRVSRITRDAVELASVGAEVRSEVAADAVVLVCPRRPSRGPVEELTAAGIPFRAVGDVTGTDDLQSAIREAAAVGGGL